jgi:rubrerythrin
MPPLALCSSPACDFRIKLQDGTTGKSISTPHTCPKCEAPMVSVCPECGFLLIDIPAEKHPRCPVCRLDIRETFARMVFGLHKPSPRFKGNPTGSESH